MTVAEAIALIVLTRALIVAEVVIDIVLIVAEEFVEIPQAVVDVIVDITENLIAGFIMRDRPRIQIPMLTLGHDVRGVRAVVCRKIDQATFVNVRRLTHTIAESLIRPEIGRDGNERDGRNGDEEDCPGGNTREHRKRRGKTSVNVNYICLKSNFLL